MSLVKIGLVFAALCSFANAACDCGFKTNTGELWQYSVITDFREINNATFFKSNDWEITSLTRQAGDVHPYAINYTPANVAVRNKLLHLTCSAYNNITSNAINSAQIQTTRDDIFYGSFRATYSVTGGAGAIGALFFYASDTEEVDLEFLTRDDPHAVHFTNQPSTSSQVNLPNNLNRNRSHHYRIDWTPGSTDFYVNNIPSSKFTTDVPTINGSVYMNMWANGGSFSGAIPPQTDATMQVESIQLYFNTSDANSAKAWTQNCKKRAVRPCLVDPQGLQKNETSAKPNHGKGHKFPPVKTVVAGAVATLCWNA